jgi:hypothetical protein
MNEVWEEINNAETEKAFRSAINYPALNSGE